MRNILPGEAYVIFFRCAFLLGIWDLRQWSYRWSPTSSFMRPTTFVLEMVWACEFLMADKEVLWNSLLKCYFISHLADISYITKPSRGISENLRLFRATFRRPFPLRQHKNEYIVIQTTATATAPNAVMDKTKLNASHHRIPHATRSMTRIVGWFLGRLGACVLLHSCHVSARYFLSPLQMQACKFGLRLTESDSQ